MEILRQPLMKSVAENRRDLLRSEMRRSPLREEGIGNRADRRRRDREERRAKKAEKTHG